MDRALKKLEHGITRFDGTSQARMKYALDEEGLRKHRLKIRDF